MNNLNLNNNIYNNRKKIGYTQQQLADYIGVTKSTISKWESKNHAYPDITVLPQLAALFNITVDELIGYQPTLSKTDVIKLYQEVSKEMSQDIQLAYQHYLTLSKKYYSCFEFLLAMAGLLLNHYMLFENSQEILFEAKSLCQRIKQESNDPTLAKEALNLEMTINLLNNEAQVIIEILGQEIRPINQDGEMIGQALFQLGELSEANKAYQINTFQHLICFFQDSLVLLQINLGDKAFCLETLKRLALVNEAYHIDQLHFNTALNYYLFSAIVYTTHQDFPQAILMIERYTHLALSYNLECLQLHGDGYFNQLDSWFEGLILGTTAPRNSKLIKDSIVAALSNPALQPLFNNPKYQLSVTKLKENYHD